MPLFRASGEDGMKAGHSRRRRRRREMEWMGSWGKRDEDGSVLSLTQLCLLSIADNMKDVWVKDYADNYVNHFSFRHIMGPFNSLPGELVEELTSLMCTRKQLSQAALHLLLVPQRRRLSLETCPNLATPGLCYHIVARCQGISSLDLSGALQLHSKALSQTITCLPVLRSLSLAGTPCDRSVIWTVALHCPLLRHLNVSSCRFLSPAALLPLGHGHSSFSDLLSSVPTPSAPIPLCSLHALDIGIGEEEGDTVAVAAFLLLSLPCLETVSMEGLTQACCLIQHRDFAQTDKFTGRERVPRLEELWRERMKTQGLGSWRKKRDGDHDGEKESIVWEGNGGDEDSRREETTGGSENQTKEKSADDELTILRLREVKDVTCDSLESLSSLCPYVHSISVNCDGVLDRRDTHQRSRLAAALHTWSGQLRSLSLHYPAPLLGLLPALQVAGSSLVSLTLEGVKTSHNTPLLEVIRSCPKLKDLLVSSESLDVPQQEEHHMEGDEHDLPCLPNLCSLSLNFFHEHNPTRPDMSWMYLSRVIRCLLAGSPLLEKLSLVSLPCPLNCVLQEVLCTGDRDLEAVAASRNSLPVPLGRVQHVVLSRTDVMMLTVRQIMQRSRRLRYVDVSYCWKITQREWSDCERDSDARVVWM